MELLNSIRHAAQRLPVRGQLRDALAFVKRPVYNRRLRQYRATNSMPVGRPRVLILMNAGVGNAIEATPLVQAVRMRWPRSHITIYVPPGDLFDDWCVVDQIVTAPAALGGRKFDLTFEAPTAEGLPQDTDGHPDFGRMQRPSFIGTYFLKPEREYNLDMVRRLGYKGECPPLYVSLRRPCPEPASSARRVIIAPGGKALPMWKNKRWPYYTELTLALLAQYPDAQIWVVGTPQDAYENPQPDNRRVIDARGRLSLNETAWVLKHSALAIGNDCGPMHIADAVQTTLLVIFGATCELKNGPLYKAGTLAADIDCRPCQYVRTKLLSCDDPVCLTELPLETVMDKVRRLLERENPKLHAFDQRTVSEGAWRGDM